jgi:hypothetical protein
MRRTIKDHRVGNNLPPAPELDLCLYHWTPTRNRQQIQKIGLVPGKKTLQGDWRPPYVCFSDEPLLAWQLSGRMYPDISSWDLWMCYFPSQTSFNHYEIILDTFIDTGRHYVKEYRIYTRIFKRDLKYVATRK